MPITLPVNFVFDCNVLQ